MDSDQIEMVKIKMPSYLSEILGYEANITFIHSKVCPIKEDGDVTETIKISKDISICELDMTGNPLTLDDLKNEDSLSMLSENQSQPNNWAKFENYFYPVDLYTARKVMNQLFLSGEFTGEEVDSGGLFCVCNGQDSKNTVLLGANPRLNYRLMTYIVKGENNQFSVEYMKNKHFKNCAYQDKISIKVLATYNLVGYNLRNIDRKNSSVNSSIILKTSWNKLAYEPLIDDITGIKVALQLIVGHHGSIFYSLQRDLLFLDHYVNIATSDVDEDIKISEDPLQMSDIEENLLNMLTKTTVKKTKIENKNKDIKPFNIEEHREEDFLDKFLDLSPHTYLQVTDHTLLHRIDLLAKKTFPPFLIKGCIITGCETLKEVCLCLTIMFEEYANNPRNTIKISDTNTSSIALIIKGIGEGKLAVPTISPAQGLLFFIELGINKLKNDYLHMLIYGTDNKEYQNILNQWKTFNTDSIDTKQTITGDQIFASRRTRLTVVHHSSKLETNALRKQLNYLQSIHIMIEFLSTLQKTSFSEDAKQEISKEIFKKYAPLKNSKDLKYLKENSFCEISMDLPNLEMDLINRLQPASWNIQLESVKCKELIRTIFYKSQNPIIPDVVYKDYEIPTRPTKNSYFALESLIICNV